MDRKEFSSLLTQQREAKKIGKNEMCRLTGFTFHQLQRIENAGNNYNIGLALRYLSAIKSSMVIQKYKKERLCTEYNQLIKWLVSARKDNNYTQRKLAEAISISYVMLARVESNKSNLSIDVLLKILEVLGYNIEIKNKE